MHIMARDQVGRSMTENHKHTDFSIPLVRTGACQMCCGLHDVATVLFFLLLFFFPKCYIPFTDQVKMWFGDFILTHLAVFAQHQACLIKGDPQGNICNRRFLLDEHLSHCLYSFGTLLF